MNRNKPTQNGQADSNGHSTVPSVSPAKSSTKQRKKALEYTYLDTPPQPTGRQNRFVLKTLRSLPAGITTVDLVKLGVADPRPRIRDLRELGYRIETIQPDPHTVGRYVLLSGKAVAEQSGAAS